MEAAEEGSWRPVFGKFLKPVGEGGTQDPRFVTFSVLANLRSRRMAPEHKEA
jgi:hypothetical protein